MRRQSRVCALQILYQLDLKRVLPVPPAQADDAAEQPPPAPVDMAAVQSALQLYWTHFDPVEPADQAFTQRLVEGVARSLTHIDGALAAAAHHWRLGRMDRVDRSLLRLATFEMLCCPDIPRAASLNEAVELAKSFSGQQSASFINGVLDALGRVDPLPVPAPTGAPAAVVPDAESSERDQG